MDAYIVARPGLTIFPRRGFVLTGAEDGSGNLLADLPADGGMSHGHTLDQAEELTPARVVWRGALERLDVSEAVFVGMPLTLGTGGQYRPQGPGDAFAGLALENVGPGPCRALLAPVQP